MQAKRQAIKETLKEGYRTRDIFNKENGDELVTTSKITDVIIDKIR